MSQMPQRTNFLSFMPVLKSPLFDSERNELFKVFGFGIAIASFPLLRQRAVRHPITRLIRLASGR